jgi:hypothetical protein
MKRSLFRLLSLYRVLDGTESDEDLVSEAVWVVKGDTATPVVVANMLLGSSAGADPAPARGKCKIADEIGLYLYCLGCSGLNKPNIHHFFFTS